jgi:predicted AlkP superfamily pyrophosphatase or phosphodiesterase
VDDAGHEFSPDSEENKQAVLRVDANLRRLLDGLKKRKIDKKVNLIVLSDHGMATVKPENSVVLDEYFDFSLTERILWTGEIVQIFPKANEENGIIEKLKPIKNAECWRKAEIPARLNYRKSPRIAPIVCSAQPGWYLTNRERLAARQKRADALRPWGAHGYDNQAESMRAFFLAHGAAFKKGLVTEPFENVNVYNIISRILNLKPTPNDGNFKIANEILK